MMRNNIYKSKYRPLPGNNRADLMKIARAIYHDYEKSTRRSTYLKTKNNSYLKGKKVFLTAYFDHVLKKSFSDQIRRLKFFQLGLDLIENNTSTPITTKKSENTIEMRFVGMAGNGQEFYVQIRKNNRGEHYLTSTFPK